MSGIATVLLVDDDDDLREVIAYVVEREDRHVIEAENGRAALDYIEANGPPDLILLDMNMPVMNGWDLARELRARRLWAAPVIVLTAAHDAERSANEIAATAFLGKPFDLTTLDSMVEQLLVPAASHANHRAHQHP